VFTLHNGNGVLLAIQVVDNVSSDSGAILHPGAPSCGMQEMELAAALVDLDRAYLFWVRRHVALEMEAGQLDNAANIKLHVPQTLPSRRQSRQVVPHPWPAVPVIAYQRVEIGEEIDRLGHGVARAWRA